MGLLASVQPYDVSLNVMADITVISACENGINRAQP